MTVNSPAMKKSTCAASAFGDPDENRTRVTAVKGRCLSRLTTGPGNPRPGTPERG